MNEKPSRLTEELEQLSEAEIEARLAAAVWVDDKKTAVLRYLEDKRAGRKKEAQQGELDAVHSARDAAWAAVDAANNAQRKAKLALMIAGIAAAAAILAATVTLATLYLSP